MLVFGGLASAIYGPEGADRAEVTRAEEPTTVEEPEAPMEQTEETTTAPDAAQTTEPQEAKPSEASVERDQSRTLYQQAVVERLPSYEIDYTAINTDHRYDVYVITEPTRDRPRLGRILVDLGRSRGPIL